MEYDALVKHASENSIDLPQAEVIQFGGVHIKKFTIKEGTLLISHCHVYDHPSILAEGAAELWTGPGEYQTLVGPTEVRIAAGVKHAITALTDITWYCIHGNEPEVVEE